MPAGGRVIVLPYAQIATVMPQVTLSVPSEKLPILTDVLNALGIDTSLADNEGAASYASNVSRSIKDTANAIYKKYFGWEYFSNELEFE